MPAANAEYGGGRKVRRKRPPASRSDAAQLTGANTQLYRPSAGLVHNVASTVTAQPKVRRRIRKVRRTEQANLRVSGDRPTPGGRTAGQDGRSGPDYRAALKYLLGRERRAMGITGDIYDPKYIPDSTPNTHLESELALLRGSTRHHTQNLLHPFGRDTYTYSYIDPNGKHRTQQVDLHQIAEQNTSHASKLEGGLDSGALKLLEQTTRPLHAIAGTVDAAVHGKNLAHGFAHPGKTTFSKVLRDVGAPGIVQSVGGFLLDVGADPTTYLTGGAGSVVRQAAEKEATRVGEMALARGLTQEQATRFAQRAFDRTVKDGAGKDARGVTVRFAGKEVPGVRRATAKVVPRKVVRRTAESRPGRAGKHVLADVNPDVAPAGVTKAEVREINRATRTARAKAHRGTYAAQQRAIAIKRQIGEENYQRVIDAIEANDVSRLPAQLQQAAIEVRSQFRYANRLRRQAGIRGGEVTARRTEAVPEVTARTAVDTANEVARARRAVAAAEHRVADTLERRGSSQGRAEILSREVNGARGERIAESAARLRSRAERSTGQPGTPSEVLRFIDAVTHSQRYPGGGHGVDVAIAEHDLAQAELATARKRLAGAEAAHTAEKQLRKTQARTRRAVIKRNARTQAAAKGYIPHVRAELPEASRVRIRKPSASSAVKTTSAKARGDVRPLAEIRKDAPGVYSEDLPRLLADRMSEASASTAKAEFNRRLADAGREIPRDNSDLASHLRPGEAVFHVKGSDLKEVTDPKALDRLTESIRIRKGNTRLRASYQARRGGRFVILNRQAVERAVENTAPSMHGPGIIKGLDKVQGGFKAVATLPNFGFHLRNLIGDTQNAYLAESVPRLARNVGQAARALRHLGKHEEALRDFTKRLDPSGAGLKIGGERVSYQDLVIEAERIGAIRSGFIARELPELAQRDITRSGDRFHRLARLIQNREDVMRLATYIGGRKRGLSAEKAAERVMKYHFDYGHLTNFERQVARRAMPFYTFTARNIPLQLRSLVTKPGKYAAYEKLREEAIQATGVDQPQPQEVVDLYDKLKQAGVDLPKGYDRYLSQYVQRDAGVPVKVNGKVFFISAGLPLTDIGMMPGLASVKDYFQRFANLATPLIKDPVELLGNVNLYFGGPLESESSPLVPAPSFAGSAAFKPFRKQLGLVRITDKKSDTAQWAWPAKVDYIAHAVPGPTNWAQRFATGSEQKAGKAGEALGYAGIKAAPFDPLDTAVGLAYDRMATINKHMAALRQQRRNGRPINADNPTPEYKRLGDQLQLAEEVVYQAKHLQGYKVLPTQGAPKKVRRSSLDWNTAGASSSSNLDWTGQDSGEADFSWSDGGP